MLMRRNVAAGIGSNEQGEYCRAPRLCSDLDRKEPRYKSPTLLYFYPSEFLDKIYPTKTRVMGLLYGENFIILISTVFTARCTLVQSMVLQSHVVCLSVCL